MGLGLVPIEAIIREAGRKPFSGNAFTFGRQTVGATPSGMLELFTRFGVPSAVTDLTKLNTDRITSSVIGHPERDFLRDDDFFRMLGLPEHHAIDVSDFEGADIVLDLNRPLPDHLEGACSGVLVDGSLLDNIFDPVCGLRNAARLMRPGARCFLHNQSNIPAEGGFPYVCLLPVWFFDYFVRNEFDYCQVYIIVHQPATHEVDCLYAISYEYAARRVETPTASGDIFPIYSTQLISVLVYAEKGAHSTWNEMPTQSQYRGEKEWRRYSEIVDRYRARQRPHLLHGRSGAVDDRLPPGYLRILEDGSAAPAE